MRAKGHSWGIVALLLMQGVVFAQVAPESPAVRPIPPLGIEVSKEVEEELREQLDLLRSRIERLQSMPESQRYLPDVLIFSEAVTMALWGDSFYDEKDALNGIELLQMGIQRADELLKGTHSWTETPGLIVRGYRSRIDGSIQPYGLVIGESFFDDPATRKRCDIWFRGRSEKGLELQFLADRTRNAGEYQLKNGLVLHPFGRYCNANRFAGEVDVFEALEHLQQDYNIDSDRISVRGFSMGGAACWGFTVHYPGKWFASNPGAGFSETYYYRGLDKQPDLAIPEYQRKLWTLYDADVLAMNLSNVPVIAYSGELDKQKQAADVMVAAAEKFGVTFPYLIGPETAHKLHPDSKVEIASQLDAWAVEGRPKKRRTVRFSTYTLKYNHCAWLTVDRLGEHWKFASVEGNVVGDTGHPQSIEIKSENVTRFSLDFVGDHSFFKAGELVNVAIDGQNLIAIKADEFGNLRASFQLKSGTWSPHSPETKSTPVLEKKHDLQGPIDDAFMDSFLFVLPSGEFQDAAVKDWVTSEQERAAREWGRQFRGRVRFKKDIEVTAEDIENSHLILWGCPQSNQYLARVSSMLPIAWGADQIAVGDHLKFPGVNHALICIYPNPHNPNRYLVLNSGVTFREADYLSNSMQTPKLPDWAVIDLSVPPSPASPGKVVDADFFDEKWQAKVRGE
ncbi:prolyl oligopeptidase family serine peptidase [Planctomicrobium sp. SH668]|uniref:prolyl oligopeptidase family serine peptidase n=1 Tax=Planctomicrobium sp. SH668 TaxID=3448126 RepID=UPI003F5B5EE4